MLYLNPRLSARRHFCDVNSWQTTTLEVVFFSISHVIYKGTKDIKISRRYSIGITNVVKENRRKSWNHRSIPGLGRIWILIVTKMTFWMKSKFYSRWSTCLPKLQVIFPLLSPPFGEVPSFGLTLVFSWSWYCTRMHIVL